MKDGTTKDDTEGEEEEEDINMEPNIETIDNDGEVYIAFYQPPDQDDKDTIGGGFDLNGTVHNLQLMVDGAVTEVRNLYIDVYRYLSYIWFAFFFLQAWYV